MKYVLVSGGVISGIGKGVIASSTGLLLKTLGLKICFAKLEMIDSRLTRIARNVNQSRSLHEC